MMTNKLDQFTQGSKRILSVTVKRMIDTDPDTSYFDEYSDTEHAIVNRGEYEGEFIEDLPCECGRRESEHKDVPEWIDTYPGSDYLVPNPEYDPEECYEYDRVGVERGRSYRYFNTAQNDSSLTTAEIREYAQQNYKRMTGLNNGDWCFIGIGAEAEVQSNAGGSIQTITSGGLWGIESDSESSYFTEIESEQLAELKSELSALGFSRRAIATAFKSVEHKDA